MKLHSQVVRENSENEQKGVYLYDRRASVCYLDRPRNRIIGEMARNRAHVAGLSRDQAMPLGVFGTGTERLLLR
jgi:hypothetical protein